MDDQQTIKGGHAIIITFALCSNLARGVIIARVKGYGRYDLLGEAYRAMDATPPALEAQDLLVVLVRDPAAPIVRGEPPEWVVREIGPRPDVRGDIDLKASGIAVYLPDLAPLSDPPPFLKLALAIIAGQFEALSVPQEMRVIRPFSVG